MIVKKFGSWGIKFVITSKYWYLAIYPSVRKASFAVELGHGLLNWINIWIFIESDDSFI